MAIQKENEVVSLCNVIGLCGKLYQAPKTSQQKTTIDNMKVINKSQIILTTGEKWNLDTSDPEFIQLVRESDNKLMM